MYLYRILTILLIFSLNNAHFRTNEVGRIVCVCRKIKIDNINWKRFDAQTKLNFTQSHETNLHELRGINQFGIKEKYLVSLEHALSSPILGALFHFHLIVDWIYFERLFEMFTSRNILSLYVKCHKSWLTYGNLTTYGV